MSEAKSNQGRTRFLVPEDPDQLVPVMEMLDSLYATCRASGDKPHVGIAGVTLHKPRPISIIEDTNRSGVQRSWPPMYCMGLHV